MTVTNTQAKDFSDGPISFYGLSTDAKPTTYDAPGKKGAEIPPRSTFMCTDTEEEYIWTGASWRVRDIGDYWLEHAIDVIYSDYGDTVSVHAKDKDLLKYGRSEQVDNTAGGTTIMTLPSGVRHERDLYANDIDNVTSASDAGKTLTVEGHTYSGGDLTFVVQDVTLDGTDPSATAATLSTPLARCSRAYLKNSGTPGSPQSDLVGDIYFWDDNGGTLAIAAGVPSDTSYVHMMIRAGMNQTEKASTSLSSQDYWVLTGAYCVMLDKSSASAAEIGVFARDVKNGGVWRKLFDMATSASGGPDFRTAAPYVIIPKNHDIRMVGIGDSASDRIVSGGLLGTLLKVVTT